MSKIYIFFSKYISKSIIIIIIFYHIQYSKCEDVQMNYKYPNCIELNNGNILIIFSTEIIIYNSDLSNEINKINFDSGFSIGENDLNLINLSKFNDGTIISIIKTALYIFSSIGEYIYHIYLDIFQGASYYSLVPVKIDNYNYYYTINYIDSSKKLWIYYYFINIDNKSNNQISYLQYSHIDSSNPSYNIANNKGLTCELMYSINSRNILTCFYQITWPDAITANSFELDNIISQNNQTQIIYKGDNNIGYGYFKSAVTKDKKKTLICYSQNGSGGRCLFYNFINNSFSEDKQYFYKCYNIPKAIHVDFYVKSKEFIFSCSDNGLGISIIKFNEEGNIIGDDNGIINQNFEFSGTKLFSYSILYLSTYSQYSIILHSDETYSKLLLLPEEFNPLNTYNIDEESYYNSESPNVESTNIDESFISESINNNNNNTDCSKYENGDIKCLYCNEESLKLNKCIECNSNIGYYPLNFNDKNDDYKFCYNEKTKLSNFYFDTNSKSYKLCYKLCNTCNNTGNSLENNCTSCIFGYKLESNIISPTNCINDCIYYSYYTFFEQYRCTQNGQCPLENNILIRPKRKCVSNCNEDIIYKFQYNSECLEKCPNDTIPNELNICKDKNTDICTLSIFNSDLNLKEIKTNNIELSANYYAKEFLYTNNHISQFNNELYSYILFKNNECIDKLSLNFSTINLGSCYKQIQSLYNTTNNLIFSIMNVNQNENKPVTLYEVFNPETGKKIDIKNICDNQNIIIKENLYDYLKYAKNLIEQNIDIFNLSSSFYTDICYHFDSKNGKDVPLRIRILSLYPNVSVCDNGCIYKSINAETLKIECECKINNFIDNYLSFNNFPFSDTILLDTLNLIKESNILVLKCYKDLLYIKYYKYNKGGYIIFSLIVIQTICVVIFLHLDLFGIKKYIYNSMESFKIYYFHNNKDNHFCPPLKIKDKTQLSNTKEENGNNYNIDENKIIKKSNNNLLIYSSQRYNSTNIIYLLNNKKKVKNSTEIKNKNSKNNKSKYDEYNVKNNIKDYLITSYDDLEFDEAIDRDKRKLFHIFIDSIKKEHFIIRTFMVSDNIRPRTIKILLFVLNINLYFIINALMYNEELISEIYNSDKEYFFYFLNNSTGKVISVSMISVIIGYLIDFFFTDEKRLKRIFLKKNFKEIKIKVSNLIKIIDKKYKIFIIITYIITIFSWYYIFCFNNVYPNTSNDWIKSTIFIIILIQLISFVKILFESILRFISISFNKEICFKLSKFLSGN